MKDRTNQDDQTQQAVSGLWRRDLLDWLRLLVAALGVIVCLFTFVIGIVGVSGSSMYPTLHHRDMMLVQRIAYTPEAGDVVVLRKADSFNGSAIVKRIIAVAGQTVLFDYDSNTVYVDGEALEEPYLNYETDDTYGEDFLAWRYDLDPAYVNTEFVVPEGCVFVCGDNRNHSSDSRVAELGMVEEGYIIGRVVMVFFPFDHFGTVK